MSLQTQLNVNLAADLQKAAVGGLGIPQHPIRMTRTLTLADGVGNDQADIAVAVTYNIAGSGSQVIDLNSITDSLGNSLTFAKVKIMGFFALAANGDRVEIGPNTSEGFNDWINGTTPEIRLEPGNIFVLSNKTGGWTITNNVNDKLLIQNMDAAAVDVEVVIIGTDT